MTTKTRRSPAKDRYDQKHPPISFRLSREYKDKLDSRTTERGISYADFIKGNLDDEGQGESYNKGHEVGYTKGSEAGYAKGYEEGYIKGRKDGCDESCGEEGWSDGYTEGWWDREEIAEYYLPPCDVCGRRFALNRSRIKRRTVGSVSIQCPFCHAEYYRHFFNHQGLKETCDALGVSRQIA